MTLQRIISVCFGMLLIFGVSIAEAATTLHLPREFATTQMATTGVAFVNPTLSDATATFRWRTRAGSDLATASQRIPGKGQLAVTLRQLFPNVAAAGWLVVDVDVDQVSAFWIGGDFSTAADGAALLSTTDAHAEPAFISFSTNTEISFANLGDTALTGNLRLYDSNGTHVIAVPFSVPAHGLYQDTLPRIFPNQAASFNSAGYWVWVDSVSSTARVIGTSFTATSDRDNVILNLAHVGLSRFLFPHVIAGPIGAARYTSLLSITNYGSTARTVSLTLRQVSGSAATVQRTIPAAGVVSATVESIFGLSSLDGWLLVDGGSGANMSGVLTYTDTATGGTTAVDMLYGNGDNALIFGHIADLPPWLTGIALANATTTDAEVEVFAFDPAGALIGGPDQSGAAAFRLPANSKQAFMLGDVIPQTRTRTSDGGYVYVRTRNGVQLFGIEIFFLVNGRVYANVPGTRMASIGYTPSNPTGLDSIGGAGAIALESTYIGNSTGEPITSVEPCTTITVNLRIQSNAGGPVDITRQYRVTGPNGYVLLMRVASGPQDPGLTRRSVTVEVPCDAPQGEYTFSGTIDVYGVVSTSTSPTQFTMLPRGGGGGGGSGGGGGGGGAGITVLADAITGCYDPYTGRSVVNAVTLLARGGEPLSGYTWTVAPGFTLPPGVALNNLNGIIQSSGGRVIPGNYAFRLQASDGSRTATGDYTMTVEQRSSEPELINGVVVPGAGCPSAVFAQPDPRATVATVFSLPNAVPGQGYGAGLYLTVGPNVTNLSWSILSGSLPPGLVLDAARGVVRGTAFSNATSGLYQFRVNVTGTHSTEGPKTAFCGDSCPVYSIRIP